MIRLERSSVLISAVLCATLAPCVPLLAQFQNPITAAKDAYKKAKQQQQQQQQQQAQPAQDGQKPPGNGSSSSAASAGSSDTAAPWVPPGSAPVTTGAAASTAAAAAAAVKLDSSKLPDVLGVHLGMTATEALAAAHKAYPDDMFVEMKDNGWPTNPKPDNGFNVHSRAAGNQKDFSMSFTAPPGEQKVWKVDRYTSKLHTNRNTLLAALRQKYGKEAFAWQGGDTTTNVRSDNQITAMLWLFDEQGNHVPMPASTVFPTRQSFEECTIVNHTDEPDMKTDADFANRLNPWCAAHFVAVIVQLSNLDIVENTYTYMMDIPLAARTARAGDAWLRDYANKVHQQDLQRSKENTPTL